MAGNEGKSVADSPRRPTEGDPVVQPSVAPKTESLLLRLPGREPVTLSGSPDDGGVIGSVRETEHYEGNVMLALSRLIAPDFVCVDGGANIGALTLAMAAYASTGHVYAFEPGRSNFEYLESNLVRNSVSNATSVQLGLWSEKTTLRLNSDPTHPAGAFVGEHGDGFTTAESIETVSLDEWVAGHGLQRLDLLKLDIEGAEPRALLGAQSSIERFKPTLLVEFNPLSLTRSGHCDP